MYDLNMHLSTNVHLDTSEVVDMLAEARDGAAVEVITDYLLRTSDAQLAEAVSLAAQYGRVDDSDVDEIVGRLSELAKLLQQEDMY